MDTSQKLFNKVKEIQRITQSIRSQISVKGGQDIVAFIGPSQSGKSTLINCLLGNPLETKYDSETEETTIVRKSNKLGPTIGNTESFIPQQYKFPDSDWHMVDFPGFGNFTRAKQEIAAAIAYAEVMRSQKSVRFVLVVPIGMIKSSNPMEFYKLLNNLVSLCPNLSGSFCIVATKSENTDITSYLKRAMQLSFQGVNEENVEIITIAQLEIKRVVELEHCIDFKEPVDKADEDFIPPNLQEIVDLIRNLEGKKFETKPPVSISDHSKLKLLELSTAIESQLRNEMKNIYKYFSKQELSRNQHSKLKELFQIINYLEKSKDYDSFSEEIKKGDFNNFPLIDNLKAITYVQSIMKMFRIDGYWNRKDEDEIFKGIRTAIRHIKNENNFNEFKKRQAETAEENSEHDKKMKHTHNPKYPSQEERPLEKRLKGPYKKNEPHSEPIGNPLHTAPISMNYSQTSNDIKDKHLVIQPQTPVEIQLVISRMALQGYFQEGGSLGNPLRNASKNNSQTSDDIKDTCFEIPLKIKLVIEGESLEKRVNGNELSLEPKRNASQTSDDVKRNLSNNELEKSSIGKRSESIGTPRKKENNDEMEGRIERRQNSGSRKKDECNIL